jgi:hypothetical protein
MNGERDMSHDYESSEQYDSSAEDARREVMEELTEYQENSCRSEEEGWFYSDEDGQDD